MRSPFVLLTALAVACGGNSDPAPAPAPAPTPAPAAPPLPIAKKKLDTTPLPPLATPPAGAAAGTGAPLRAAVFGGLGLDAPTAIAVAPNGDAYVVGYFDGEMKLGALGTFTPPQPKASADAKKKPKPTSNAFLAKVTPAGAIAWIQTWGAKRDDVARGVAYKDGTIVVVGNFTDTLVIGEKPTEETEQQNPAANSDDLFVAAFDEAGKSLWVYTAGGVDSDGANAVAPAADGGWYIGGSFTKIASFEATRVEYKSAGATDAFLLKLGKTGDFEWVKQFGGRYDDTILHLASDARGNVYIQGVFMDTVAWGGAPLVAAGGKDNDIALVKLDANGDHVWSKRFGEQYDDVAGGIAVDPAGNVTIVGAFDRTISFGDGDEHSSRGEADAYIARFDPAGKLLWARTFGADRNDVGWGVAADATGATVMSGWFEGTVDFGRGPTKSHGNKDVFVLKHDAAGALVWAQTFGDRDHDQARGIAVDKQGAAVVAGLYRFTFNAVTPALDSVRAAGDRIPQPDVFVVRLDR